MATKANSSTGIDPFVHEHEALQETLGDLRKLLEARRSPKEVAPLLAEFADHVLAHFVHEEEEEGFFEAVIEQAPRLKGRADALIEEHVEMARELERLQQCAAAGDASADWWSAMTEAFDSFWLLFRRHERSEHDLMQEAFHDDIGAED